MQLQVMRRAAEENDAKASTFDVYMHAQRQRLKFSEGVAAREIDRCDERPPGGRWQKSPKNQIFLKKTTKIVLNREASCIDVESQAGVIGANRRARILGIFFCRVRHQHAARAPIYFEERIAFECMPILFSEVWHHVSVSDVQCINCRQKGGLFRAFHRSRI